MTAHSTLKYGMSYCLTENKKVEQDESNRFLNFGPEMEELVRRINNTKFIRKPRGPQGACYTVNVSFKNIKKFEKWDGHIVR